MEENVNIFLYVLLFNLNKVSSFKSTLTILCFLSISFCLFLVSFYLYCCVDVYVLRCGFYFFLNWEYGILFLIQAKWLRVLQAWCVADQKQKTKRQFQCDLFNEWVHLVCNNFNNLQDLVHDKMIISPYKVIVPSVVRKKGLINEEQLVKTNKYLYTLRESV